MKNNIAFDIDGCVVDLVTQLKEKLAGDNITIIDYGAFKLKTEPAMSNSKLWKYFYACYEDYKKTPIYPGAAQLFIELYKRTFQPIHFVTSRPANSATATHKLINRVCKPPFTISFRQDPFSKIDYLNGTRYFVEDRRKTVLEMANTGRINVFMPIRHWNYIDPHVNVTRMANIGDLNHIIDDIVSRETHELM